MLNRIQTVKIYWSKPVALEHITHSQHYNEEIGLYLVSRKYIRNHNSIEKITYVGETYNGFGTRIKQHLYRKSQSSRWVDTLGEKYIRFGKIIKTPTIVDNNEHLLWTLESAIIQSIIGLPNVALTNKRQISSWSIWYDLIIENSGFHSIIPSIINTRDFYSNY